MKKILFLFPVIFAGLILFSGCRKKVSEKPLSDAQAISTQQNINRFFHKSVIPSLSPNWDSIATSGFITIEYVFEKSKDQWIYKSLRSDTTTLNADQQSMALQMMSRAMTKQQLKVDDWMSRDSILYMHWTWPIPFPKGEFDESKGEFVALFNNSGLSGGCDGMGMKARCNACGDNGCIWVCIGSLECDWSPSVCAGKYYCVSGGAFGTLRSNLFIR